jgi:hypothetical protein
LDLSKRLKEHLLILRLDNLDSHLLAFVQDVSRCIFSLGK